ncbi:uncharacterized protein LTR77_008112 [Saxophila tyrrhenica]|uniref:Anaphase-promoting complex subunit 4 n=1 Tax=Saxophila tyrrhenica TaxID=1690608 RepID=A0AAV9P5W1_9PEZI|nr:hypothetical protein LTR77_008112 [Saxophila tyrrhenica]
MALEDDSHGEKLPLLFEKHVSQPVATAKAAYCDLYDLIAVINLTTDDVAVYRAANGQLAFTAKYPDQYEESKPQSVSWKADGSLLGVSWDDGTCCLYSGEDGKLVSRIAPSAESKDADWRLDLASALAPVADESTDGKQAPSCLAWTDHQRSGGLPLPPLRREEKFGDELSTETWFNSIDSQSGTELGKMASGSSEGLQALVDSVTTLDVTTVLPGLSALPAHGMRSTPDAAKFNTQSGVDNAFKTTASVSDAVDVLLVCGSSQHADIYLDDTVKVGSISLDTSGTFHASHPHCSTQAVLSRPDDGAVCNLHFIDLPLDTLGGSLLHVIATNTKRMQSLVAYVTQTVRCIQHDFTTGQQLPTRLLNGFTEELREKDESDPFTSLYELLMTARFTPTVEEWLTDIIKDTQRKRWEESIVNLYDHIQNHIFMHLLPALNRMSIAASTLRGFAELHEGTTTFDMPATLLVELEDNVDALRLAAERAQLIVIAEQRQFRAFIKWLRVMIDVASAGPGSKSAIETEQRETPNVDVNLTGAYIKLTMRKSKLFPYIEQLPEMKGGLDSERFFDHPVVRSLNRENTVASLQQKNSTSKATPDFDEGTLSNATAALNLPALTARLVAQVRLCLDKITAWQQRLLSRQASSGSPPVEMTLNPTATLLDMKMYPSSAVRQDDGSIAQMLFSAPGGSDDSKIDFFRVDSSSGAMEEYRSEISFNAATVLHAQMVSVSTCFVLVQVLETSPADASCELLCCRLENEGPKQHGSWSKHLKHSFSTPPQAAFTPKHFVVGGRPGKQVVVVFGGDGRSWRVLDLTDYDAATPIRRGKERSGDQMTF